MINMAVVDFHSHIMPGLDHGCDSRATAKTQLNLANSAGVDIIVSTSHFYPHERTAEHFIKRRQEAYERLLNVMGTAFKPQVILGAEVLFCEHMEQMEGLESLCIGDSKHILLEMPFGEWKKSWFDSLFEIYDRLESKVILAHVDRYSENDIEYLLDHGFKAQLNASACGLLGVPKKYLKWIDRGAIVGIGSDIHGTKEGYRRFVKMRKSLNNLFNDVMLRSCNILGIN